MVDPAGLAKLLGIPLPSAPVPHFTHRVSVRLTRTGRAVRLIQDDGAVALARTPDPALIRLLLKARRYWAELSLGQVAISTLARREVVTPSYLTRVVRLAFLAPAVVEAILAGTTRADVDGMALLATGAIPASWDAQVGLFLPTDG